MNESIYCFGDFRLIPAQRELWRAGQQVSVQPRVLEAITYLIEHRDRAVCRDELIAAVWGRVDVADSAVRQMIARARQVIEDDADEQHSIRTLPRFGYRWVRDVERAPDIRHAPPIGIARRWLRVAATTTFLCAIGLLASASRDSRLTGESATHQLPTTASAPTNGDPLPNLRAALAAGQLDVARAILHRLSDPDRLRPAMRYEEAMLALDEGRFDGALAGFTSLLSDLGVRGDPLTTGQAHYGAGLAEVRLGHDKAAQTHFERAIRTLNGTPGRNASLTRGRTWSTLGRLHADHGRFDAADRAYAWARSALEHADDPAALAALESNIGVLLIGRYRYAEALPRFQRAAELGQRAGNATTEARARMNQVNDCLVLLQPAAALPAVARLRDLRPRIGDPMLAAAVDLVRARALIANGRLGEAGLLLKTNASRPLPSDPLVSAFRDIVSADLAFTRGAYDTGSRHVQAALASPWSAPENDVAAYARWRLVEARQALGDAEGADDAAAEAEAQSRASPDQTTVALYAMLSRGDVADARGDMSGAWAAYRRALALADANRVPFDLVRVIGRYAHFLIRHGQTAEAAALADRLSPWTDLDYTTALTQLQIYHALGSEAWSAALDRVRHLAGERAIPMALTRPQPSRSESRDRVLVAAAIP